MKKIIFCSLIFSFISLAVTAQIKEAEGKMSQGQKPCMVVTFENAEAEVLEESWIDYQKNFKGKTKKDKKSGEIFSDDSEIKEISDNTVDLYSRVDQNGKNVELRVWFDLGGAYMSAAAHPDKARSAKTYLANFEKEYGKEVVTMQIDEKEDQIKDLEKEIKNIEKENKDMSQEIEKMEEKIKEYQKTIKENEKVKSEKESALKSEQQALKTLESTLKGLKK